jgi:hypothetical protein
MAFPQSPTNGQQANINGITYTYSSSLTAWTVSTSVSNTFVNINVSANVNSGNLLATGLASVTGNIFGGNVLVSGASFNANALPNGGSINSPNNALMAGPITVNNGSLFTVETILTIV